MDQYLHFQEQLKELGLKIETIAHKMGDEGFAHESEELEKLGMKIEHFGDDLELASIIAKSQSTVPISQASG